MISPAARTDLEDSILSCCKSLFLTSAIPELIKQEGTPKQIEYLAGVLQAELDRREENRRGRLVKRARFPVYKTFEGYEYRCVKLPPALSKEELEEAAFLREKNNLVLYGPVGTGKTHMAVAAGIRACMKGYKVRFYTVTELVLKLAEARKNGTLERLRSELNGLDLLILDEFGLKKLGQTNVDDLYEVISRRYEASSTIITSNKQFDEWGSILFDPVLATAILDRFVHHCSFVIIEGESYRMKERERITSTKRRGRPKKDAGAQSQETEADAE